MCPRRTALLLFLLLLSAAVSITAGADGAGISVPEAGSGGSTLNFMSIKTIPPASLEPLAASVEVGMDSSLKAPTLVLMERQGGPARAPMSHAVGAGATEFRENHAPSGEASVPLGLPSKDDARAWVPAVLLIAFLGLVNGIIPCRVKILYALTRMLEDTGTRRRIAVLGGAFALGISAFYLAAGSCITMLIAVIGAAVPFQLLAGVVALLVGLAGIAASMLSRPTFPPVIPRAGHDIIKTWFEAARTASPGYILVLGGVIGFIELPVTVGGYLGVLGLLAGRSPGDTISLLMMYNLIFALPLVLMVAAVALGLAPASLESWRKDRRRLVRGFTGVVLVALGLLLLLIAIGAAPMPQ